MFSGYPRSCLVARKLHFFVSRKSVVQFLIKKGSVVHTHVSEQFAWCSWLRDRLPRFILSAFHRQFPIFHNLFYRAFDTADGLLIFSLLPSSIADLSKLLIYFPNYKTLRSNKVRRLFACMHNQA